MYSGPTISGGLCAQMAPTRTRGVPRCPPPPRRAGGTEGAATLKARVRTTSAEPPAKRTLSEANLQLGTSLGGDTADRSAPMGSYADTEREREIYWRIWVSVGFRSPVVLVERPEPGCDHPRKFPAGFRAPRVRYHLFSVVSSSLAHGLAFRTTPQSHCPPPLRTAKSRLLSRPSEDTSRRTLTRATAEERAATLPGVTRRRHPLPGRGSRARAF